MKIFCSLSKPVLTCPQFQYAFCFADALRWNRSEKHQYSFVAIWILFLITKRFYFEAKFGVVIFLDSVQLFKKNLPKYHSSLLAVGSFCQIVRIVVLRVKTCKTIQTNNNKHSLRATSWFSGKEQVDSLIVRWKYSVPCLNPVLTCGHFQYTFCRRSQMKHLGKAINILLLVIWILFSQYH